MANEIDISRKSQNVIFDPEVSSEIISKAVEESAIMQLARPMQMVGAGMKFQTITGDPEPQWVEETGIKSKGTFTFGTKTVVPCKMALIVPFSDEFRRDKSGLYNECVGRLPRLFGKKLDATVMGTTAPGANFDVLGGATKVSLIPSGTATVYDQFLAADAAISAHDGIMNGIALAPQGRSLVLGATDTTGHPLFTAGVESGTVGNILGASVTVKKGVYVAAIAANVSENVAGSPAVVGVAGDFDNISYGIVQQITGSIAEQATITVNNSAVNLWERNMFAIRFEMEIAVMVRDLNTFVLLTGSNA